MQIDVRGKNIDVTPALQEHVVRKFGRIGRYFDEATTMTVLLSVQKNRHIVEATLSIDGGRLIRGEEETEDMYGTIDRVVDKIERQIRKYKTRINRRDRREAGAKPLAQPAADAAEQQDVNGELPRIVRTKRFAVKPMDVDEAILQMEMLGHDFFIFRDAESDEVHVLYRRRDGNYGLIEPQR